MSKYVCKECNHEMVLYCEYCGAKKLIMPDDEKEARS